MCLKMGQSGWAMLWVLPMEGTLAWGDGVSCCVTAPAAGAKSELGQSTGPGDPGGEMLTASNPNPCSEHPAGSKLGGQNPPGDSSSPTLHTGDKAPAALPTPVNLGRSRRTW